MVFRLQVAVTETDLCVLVGGNCRERHLGEGECLKDAPANAVQVIGLDDVKTRLVAVHGVHNNLQEGLMFIRTGFFQKSKTS